MRRRWRGWVPWLVFAVVLVQAGSGAADASFQIAAGTWISGPSGQLEGPAFQLDAATSSFTATVTGPTGIQHRIGGPPQRFPGMPDTRSINWCSPSSCNVPSAGGSWTVTGDDGTAASFSIDATSRLTPVAVNAAASSANAQTVTAAWTAGSDAQSFIVYVHPASSTSATDWTAGTVLPGSARSTTFSGLSLDPTTTYSIDVFAFSDDIVAGTPPAVFNVASDRLDFLPSAGIDPFVGPHVGTLVPSLPSVLSPPAASTWPPYPHFPSASCYTGAPGPSPVQRYAPSELPPAPASKPTPDALLSQVLAGLPDRSLVRGGHFGPLPATVREHLRGYFGRSPQPHDALWLYLDAPLAAGNVEPKGPAAIARWIRAQWEATLVAGAVRDLMCSNRERQLVGWYATDTQPPDAGYNRNLAFGQSFPNLSPAELQQRVATVASTLGVTVVSVQLLHPLQSAPAVVFSASNESEFIAELPEIEQYLAPYGTFEGVFIEGVDSGGMPFVAVFNNQRGLAGGGQWSATGQYPFLHG